jgi:hypothetical protein
LTWALSCTTATAIYLNSKTIIERGINQQEYSLKQRKSTGIQPKAEEINRNTT